MVDTSLIPDTPSIPPAEPLIERFLLKLGIGAVYSEETLTKVHLPAVRSYLLDNGLDVDEDGFIVHTDSGDYAEPYGFSDDTWEAADSPSDSPLDDYFVGLSDTSDWLLTEQDRLHLTDLHALCDAGDGDGSHPVPDDTTMLDRFHRRTGRHFHTVMDWSDTLSRLPKYERIEDIAPTVEVHQDTWTSEDYPVQLNCIAPSCQYTGPADHWLGDSDDPVCPECGGAWTDNVTVCTGCGDWHRGPHFEGKSRHAKPSCPNCNAGTNLLHPRTHYTEIDTEPVALAPECHD
ncbi:hypothetical protein RYH80_17990 [Halobaculum sp. MBLA0147]|uniref:hypothetical protein n=1 Tax=Halobaculum sp. MBLA0147 TaxID=3079934 RepID=UPI003523EDA6